MVSVVIHNGNIIYHTKNFEPLSSPMELGHRISCDRKRDFKGIADCKRGKGIGNVDITSRNGPVAGEGAGLLCLEQPALNTVTLVSSQPDLVPLVAKLRDLGRRVVLLSDSQTDIRRYGDVITKKVFDLFPTSYRRGTAARPTRSCPTS